MKTKIEEVIDGVFINSKSLQDELKKQDKQYASMRKAKELADNGEVKEAICILEKIMYKDGMVVRGVTWPFILADIYYRNNMLDDCWKYLNFLFTEFPNVQDKTRAMQAKILKKEKKYIDGLVMKMSSMLIRYTKVSYKPSQEKINKELNAFIKKAKLEDKRSDILALYNKHVKNKFDEIVFRNEFKKIFLSGNSQTGQAKKNWFAIGKKRIEAKQYEEAVAALCNALKIDLNNEKVYYLRAVAYSKSGDRQKALEDIKTAARLGHPKAIEYLQKKTAG
jgi:tetratricopeptide (TPR) repeat protein